MPAVSDARSIATIVPERFATIAKRQWKRRRKIINRAVRGRGIIILVPLLRSQLDNLFSRVSFQAAQSCDDIPGSARR